MATAIPHRSRAHERKRVKHLYKAMKIKTTTKAPFKLIIITIISRQQIATKWAWIELTKWKRQPHNAVPTIYRARDHEMFTQHCFLYTWNKRACVRTLCMYDLYGMRVCERMCHMNLTWIFSSSSTFYRKSTLEIRKYALHCKVYLDLINWLVLAWLVLEAVRKWLLSLLSLF